MFIASMYVLKAIVFLELGGFSLAIFLSDWYMCFFSGIVDVIEFIHLVVVVLFDTANIFVLPPFYCLPFFHYMIASISKTKKKSNHHSAIINGCYHLDNIRFIDDDDDDDTTYKFLTIIIKLVQQPTNKNKKNSNSVCV